MTSINMGMWWEDYPQSVLNLFDYIDKNSIRWYGTVISAAANRVIKEQNINAEFWYDSNTENMHLTFYTDDARLEFELRWA